MAQIRKQDLEFDIYYIKFAHWDNNWKLLRTAYFTYDNSKHFGAAEKASKYQEQFYDEEDHFEIRIFSRHRTWHLIKPDIEGEFEPFVTFPLKSNF